MVPLALTRTERRLAAATAVVACVPAAVAAASLVGWCLAATADDLLGATLIGLAIFTPTWAALVAGLQLGRRARGGWMDTSALPRPTVALVAAGPLVIATTAYDRLDPLDPWRWASLLPALAALLALALLGSTLWRRWRRRDAQRWSPVRAR